MATPKPKTSDRRAITRRRLLKGLLALGAAGGLGVSEWNSKRRIQLREETLRLPRWKANGFRVTVLSDLHVDSPERSDRAKAAFRLAIQQKSDLIVILGDFVSGHHPGMFIELQKALDPLDETRVPVLSVLGNHDYAVARLPLLHEKMAMRRARVLRNEVVRVGEVTVWGIDDGLYGKDRHGELSARDDSGSVLALFHEPDFVDRVDDRVGLVLSGHTHGGQICLPFGIPLHLPRGGRKYRDGFYPEAPRPLFVTRGVGTIGPDLRTFCPPEVCVLTLVGT